MADQSKVAVVDPDGELGTIDASEAHEALKPGNGYRLANQDEMGKLQDIEQYGSHPGMAALAGAARTLTFGGSDFMAPALGIASQRDLSKLKEYNPKSSTAGELGGVGLGLLLPGIGEAGAAKSAAAATKAMGLGAEDIALASRMARGDLRAGDIINPVKGLAKISQGVTEGVGSFLGQPQSAIGRAATSALSHGIGSAVEGAGYGVGQSISEYALGDPSLNGEKFLANVGVGALLGGGIGGSLGAAGELIPASLKASKEALSTVYDRLAGPDETGVGLFGRGYAKASSFVSGKPYEDILELLKNKESVFTTQAQKLEMAESFAKDLDAHYKAINKASYDGGNLLKPQEIQAHLMDVDPTAPRELFQKHIGALDDAIKEMRAEPDIYPARIPRQLELIKQRIEGSVTPASDSFKIFNALEDMKSTIRTGIKFGKIPAAGEIESQSILKGLSSDLKSSLENTSVWGEAGAAQAKYNEATNSFLTNQNLFKKSFMEKFVTKSGGVGYRISPNKVNSFFTQINKATGSDRARVLQEYLGSSGGLIDQLESLHQKFPIDSVNPQELRSLLEKTSGTAENAIEQSKLLRKLGGLEGGAHNTYIGEGVAGLAALHSPMLGAGIEAINMLRNSPMAVRRLANISSMVDKTTAMISRAAKEIFSDAKLVGEKTAGYIGAKTASEMGDDHNKNAKLAVQVKSLISNPESMINALHENTQQAFSSAPDTVGAAHAATVRAAQYLAASAPETKSPYPLGEDPIPSKSDLNIYAERVHVIENPAFILKELRRGTLVPAHIEAVATVYPKLFQEMQQSVISELTNAVAKKQDIPYKTKNMLSMFLGQDLDASITPQAVLANQASLAQSQITSGQQDQMMMGRTTQNGLGKMNMANNLKTDMQQSGQRIDKG